jgi:hypothetical protein
MVFTRPAFAVSRIFLAQELYILISNISEGAVYSIWEGERAANHTQESGNVPETELDEEGKREGES